MAPRPKAALARTVSGPDADEAEALAYAAAKLKELSPTTSNVEAVATAVISTWIVERVKRHADRRLSDELVFDLGDAHTRGFIEAALPQIGANLGHLPPTIPLFQMSKMQIVDVLTAGVKAWREAAIVAGECPGYPYSDPIPFGD